MYYQLIASKISDPLRKEKYYPVGAYPMVQEL